MKTHVHRKARLAVAATAAVVAVAATVHARTADAVTVDAAYRAETARIQRHFDSVLVELRAPVARPLGDAQRRARAERIATLQAYRDRAVFPHNHEFFDGWMPYFVDHRGVRCAVAFLLDASGRADIVDRVRAADNNVWVADLRGDTAFASWLDASGLTLAEAARIQVPYVGEAPEQSLTATRSDRVNTGLAAASAGLGVASMVWNARARGPEHRVLRMALGYGAGAMGLALASGRRNAEGGALALGLATGAVGMGSAVFATWTLLEGGRGASPAAPRPTTASSLSVAPAVLANGDRMAPGITMHLRF